MTFSSLALFLVAARKWTLGGLSTTNNRRLAFALFNGSSVSKDLMFICVLKSEKGQKRPENEIHYINLMMFFGCARSGGGITSRYVVALFFLTKG